MPEFPRVPANSNSIKVYDLPDDSQLALDKDLPDARNLLNTASMLHSYCTINCANYWVTVDSSEEEAILPLISTPGGMSFYILWSTYLLTVFISCQATLLLWVACW